MSRIYLEYFDGAFDSTVVEKIQPENKPYVAYSKTEGVVYTVVPKPATSPADNEIWYTTSDESIINPTNNGMDDFISNTYDNGLGKLVYEYKIMYIEPGGFQQQHNLVSIYLPSSIVEIHDFIFDDCPLLNQIYYSGTVAQWEAIEKYGPWNSGCLEITVHCTDGDITIPAAN